MRRRANIKEERFFSSKKKLTIQDMQYNYKNKINNNVIYLMSEFTVNLNYKIKIIIIVFFMMKLMNQRFKFGIF